MKAIDVINHIQTLNLNNSQYATFRYYENDGETPVEFVGRYFGGNFIAGWLIPETNYIAFWAPTQPKGVPDAVFTDDNDGAIYAYEVE